MLQAVIGIGSNSTRLLIGEVEPGKMKPVLRMREGTRLFAGLSEGMLTEESMLRTADTSARFAKIARDQGAEHIHIIATSAARDAGNGAGFCALVESLCGARMAIITGEEEARLSFIGCTGGGWCGMIDIGGGSTELAVGGGGRPFAARSVQLGAVRLKGEAPDLSGEGFGRALSISRERAAAGWRCMAVQDMPAAWYGAGGTLTCLASLDIPLAKYDREAVHGHVLTRGAVERMAQRLSGMPEEALAGLPGMIPQRADIIAHGAVALLGVMEALSIPSVTVSNRSNLDGYLLDIAGKLPGGEVAGKVQAYYDAKVEQEWERLEKNFFEFEINKRYIDRYVKPGNRVLDVGGGPGRYSLYMASRGVDVTLIDLSPGNVGFALGKAEAQGVPLKALSGDARQADTLVEGMFDAILLMGPLYHLLTEADRAQAVSACLRRLKPGGVLFAAFISIAAGMIYAARDLPESILWEGEDTFYEKIIAREDFAGAAFTQAYFIEPRHVLPFMAKFPLENLHLLASEGITAPFHTSLAGQPPEVIAKWTALSLALCEREDLLCYGEHLLYIGRKKGEENP